MTEHHRTRRRVCVVGGVVLGGGALAAAAIQLGAPAAQASNTDSSLAEAPQTASRAPEAAASVPTPQRRPRFERAVLEVRRGDTLMGVLRRVGIEASAAYKAARELGEVTDVSQLKPGQRIRVRLGGAPGHPTLKGVRLRASATEDAVARRAGDSFRAATRERELTQRTRGAAGTIRNSLFAAGRRHDVPPKIMLRVIRKFSYQVDFQRDLRPGAKFELLYRTKTAPSGKRAVTGPLLYAAVERGGERLEMYHFRDGGRDTYFTPEGKSVRRLLMRTPLNGARISSGFGMREHPISGYTRMHEGIDFAAPRGTPVYASGSGVVDFAGRNGGYGKYLEINHRDPYQTAYGHLDRFAEGIEPGAYVNQGEVVAYVGNTGLSTGPHLHYEILRHSEPVNPRGLDLPTGRILDGESLERFRARVKEIDRLRREHTGATKVATAN